MVQYTFIVFTAVDSRAIKVRLMPELTFLKFVGDYFGAVRRAPEACSEKVIFVETYEDVATAKSRLAKVKKMAQARRAQLMRSLNASWKSDELGSTKLLTLVKAAIKLIANKLVAVSPRDSNDEEGQAGTGVLAPIGPRPTRFDSFREPIPTHCER